MPRKAASDSAVRCCVSAAGSENFISVWRFAVRLSSMYGAKVALLATFCDRKRRNCAAVMVTLCPLPCTS